MKKLIAALFLSAFLAPAAGYAQDLGIQIGKRAPAAMVTDLNGKKVNIGSFVGKTPLLIEFWATWCANCQHLEPSLLAAQRKYGSRVRFLGVAVSANQSPERVRLYAARHKLKHDILYDDEGNATDAYDVPATSYIVVVNKQGKVVYTGVGGDQNIEAALRKAL